MSDNYASLDSTAQTKVAPATDLEIADYTGVYGKPDPDLCAVCTIFIDAVLGRVCYFRCFRRNEMIL
jgi:hypothetical protein